MFSAEAADPVNCDPEKGMVDLDRCPQGKPLLVGRGARLHDVDGMGYNATAYALNADRRSNWTHLKSLGLVTTPDLERQLKESTLLRKCLDEVVRRGLSGEAQRRFFDTCYQPTNVN